MSCTCFKHVLWLRNPEIHQTNFAQNSYLQVVLTLTSFYALKLSDDGFLIYCWYLIHKMDKKEPAELSIKLFNLI